MAKVVSMKVMFLLAVFLCTMALSVPASADPTSPPCIFPLQGIQGHTLEIVDCVNAGRKICVSDPLLELPCTESPTCVDFDEWLPGPGFPEVLETPVVRDRQKEISWSFFGVGNEAGHKGLLGYYDVAVNIGGLEKPTYCETEEHNGP
ncbi:MAG: hypothetical protein AABY18_02255 [Candidatus Thermoplasmatota archaeon]